MFFSDNTYTLVCVIRVYNYYQKMKCYYDESSLFQPKDEEGWEYALTFKSKFHAQKKPLYNVRRRRWRQQLVGDKNAVEPLFVWKDEEKGKNEVRIQ